MAVFSSYAEGAPGPDGFPFLFYQKFWDTIKFDLMALFAKFETGTLDLHRLNFSMITLIPKENDATSIKKYRPIALTNCSFKKNSKACTNRISPCANRIISPNQTVFLKGRYLLESVVVAHEIIHEAHTSSSPGLILKLDYEKVYDRVDISFLRSVLRQRGFPPLWLQWMDCLLLRGSFGVRINDCDSPFFATSRGLRQGDPLSPILFNLVADVFTKILTKAATNNLISGMFPAAQTGGVVSLQYADDTLLFLDNDIHKARNLKWFLSLFEQLSGMRINFHKSDLYCINLDDDAVRPFSQTLGCKLEGWPMKYLEVPLHFCKLKKEDLQPVIDKILKRVAGWRDRLLSYGGRITLIRSCLASIPIYLLSVIKFPKWAIKEINSQMAHCLWDNYDGHVKYHLVNWELVSMEQDFGGLGIPSLRDLNICLLANWIKRFNLDSHKLWKNIIDLKYNTASPNIFACSDSITSPFWKGVLWASQAAKMGYIWKVGNGASVKFWEDQWIGGSSLAIQFWEIYYVCNEHNKTIADIWDGVELKLSFGRGFNPHLMQLWMI